MEYSLNAKKKQFDLYDAALATLLFVILNVLFIESFYMYAATSGVSSFGVLIAQFLVEALFGVTSVIVAKYRKIDLFEASGIKNKISITMIIYAVLIAVVLIIFFSGLTSAFLELLTLIGYKSSLGSMPINSISSYLFYVVAVCITPAVCEELLFRGTIQAGLKKYGKWISIFASAFIFTIMHGGPEQTVHQFIVGLITGILFFETGNLWIGVIIHFFNNFISVTEMFIFNVILNISLEETEETVQNFSTAEAFGQFVVNLFVALIFAAIGYIIIRVLIKNLIKESNRINQKNANVVINVNAQNILVDGQETETEILVSNEESENFNKNKKNIEVEKPKIDKKTILLFAIPIAWLMFQWVYALIQGFGG